MESVGPGFHRVLVTRTDRLGDAVLATPVLAALRAARPDLHVGFMVSGYAAPLFQGHPHVDRLHVVPNARGFDRLAVVSALASELANERYDAALILWNAFEPAVSTWRAGIPVRVAPASKIVSALATRRVPQRRSEARRHEAEYNLDLARVLFSGIGTGIPPMLSVTESETRSVRACLPPGTSPLVVVHPGAGGSARNLRPERYGEIAREIAGRGVRVLISHGPGEESVRDRVFAAATRGTGIGIAILPETLPLRPFMAVLAQASVVLAGSTGPLHIATAVGATAVGVFGPIRVTRARRWGPFPPESHRVCEPVNTPACERCLGPQCAIWDCMDSIPISQIVSEVLTAIASRRAAA